MTNEISTNEISSAEAVLRRLADFDLGEDFVLADPIAVEMRAIAREYFNSKRKALEK